MRVVDTRVGDCIPIVEHLRVFRSQVVDALQLRLRQSIRKQINAADLAVERSIQAKIRRLDVMRVAVTDSRVHHNSTVAREGECPLCKILVIYLHRNLRFGAKSGRDVANRQEVPLPFSNNALASLALVVSALFTPLGGTHFNHRGVLDLAIECTDDEVVVRATLLVLPKVHIHAQAGHFLEAEHGGTVDFAGRRGHALPRE